MKLHYVIIIRDPIRNRINNKKTYEYIVLQFKYQGIGMRIRAIECVQMNRKLIKLIISNYRYFVYLWTFGPKWGSIIGLGILPGLMSVVESVRLDSFSGKFMMNRADIIETLGELNREWFSFISVYRFFSTLQNSSGIPISNQEEFFPSRWFR